MLQKRKYGLSLLGMSVVLLLSSFSFQEIDLQQVEKKSLKKFLHKIVVGKMEFNFEKFKGKDFCFFSHERSYSSSQDLYAVWKKLTTRSPFEIFETNHTQVGLVFDPADSSFHYSPQESVDLREGQILFLTFSYAKGTFQMANAMRVDKIDEENKEICLSYPSFNRTMGQQKISLINGSNGGVKVVHSSLFRSGRKVYDYAVYPFFHDRLLKDFYYRLFR